MSTGPAPAADVARLAAALEVNSCEVHLVRGDDLASEVARLTRSRAGGGAVAIGDEDDRAAAPHPPTGSGLAAALAEAGAEVLTPDDPAWSTRLRSAEVGITIADVAAAAEGVMGIRSGPGRPRATSLVPPLHLCVVPAAAVEPDLGAALRRIATAGMPSAMTWIGGPSRTGDLEMRTVMGVHGPLSVVVVIATDP